MPPPKNGSLGRGLGDLMGGLPKTIGVAQHHAPGVIPPRPSVVVSSTPVAAQAPVQTPAKVLTAASTRKPRRDPQQLLLILSVMVVLLVTGAGIGLLAANWLLEPAQVSAMPSRLVMVTNVVVVSSASVRPKPMESLDFMTFRPNWVRAGDALR